MGLIDEIREQPEVIGRLIHDRGVAIAAIGAEVRQRDIDTVVIAARGTSDHAAIYAQYVFGVRHRRPVALAAPSVLSLYGVEPQFRRALVIGISQSGGSPDVVGVVAAARRQGVPTIAITNAPGSALADAAEHLIDLGAGPERSIAATKTYTAELAAIALLSAGMRPSVGDAAADTAEIAAVPDALRAVLEVVGPSTAAAARAFATINACTVLGRGFEYATAREWALKLKELASVVADPYSAADFQHGPIALVEPGSAVFLVAPSGRGAVDADVLIPRLAEYGARLLVLSDRADLLAQAEFGLALPSGVAEWVMPIVSVVPAQLFAVALASARGRDPERPRHITKVTATR